ncbi:MAG: chloride channel protein [Acidobacteriota bacterium]
MSETRGAGGPLSMSDTQRFLLISVLIGVFAGLIVTVFHVAIDLLSWSGLGIPPGEGQQLTVVVPALGAGVAALFVRYVAKSAAGSGINYTKAAIYVSDGYIPAASVVGKFVACTASIGTGAPLGPEDPALQMGAGAASLLGRTFRLTRDHMRLIAPVGAAAGIAAAFNTPIAALLFVIEEVLSGWNAGVLGSIVLASVSASVVTRTFLGDQPLFRVPDFLLTDYSELAVYAAIGLVSGILAVLYSSAILGLRRATLHTPAPVAAALPFLAGLAVGLVAYVFPGVLGAGYFAIDAALHNEFLWPTLLILGFAKAALTACCIGTGVPGGLFAPTLFVGAMLGGGIGGLAAEYWPAPVSPISAYVLVGMGAFFAAVFRTPMTSIFMVFELSATYVILLPVMVANTVAYLVAWGLQQRSLFSRLGSLEGTRFPSADDLRGRDSPRVEEVMAPLESAPDEAIPEIHPDEPMNVALGLLRRHRVLLVVSRDAPTRILGTLSRDRVSEWLASHEAADQDPGDQTT